MIPYYEDAASGITIYHGRCEDVLPTLEPSIVDLVLTDPPYGKRYSTGHRSGVVRSSTAIANDGDLSALDGMISAVGPTLTPRAALYCFAAPLRLDDVLPMVRRIGDVPNVIVWDKGNCTAGDLETTYGMQWEAIIYARTQRFPLIGGRDRDVIRIPRGNTAAYEHPTQKPVQLFAYLIARHAPALVLDPFMGSGTAALAARQMGAAFIGIELEERYCEIAAKRLQQSVMVLA